jgi:hypothetical protein
MNRCSVWYTLSYIGTRLRALVLGSVSFAWVRCTARATLVKSAAPYVPQGILLLVWSVKALSASRHVFLLGGADPLGNVDSYRQFLDLENATHAANNAS